MSEKKTLGSEDIVTEKKISRRSTMGVIGAGAAVLGVAAVVATPGEAHATCTDSDSGPNADPAGRGRGRGVTDSDPSDSPGCGRRQCSDSDPSDPQVAAAAAETRSGSLGKTPWSTSCPGRFSLQKSRFSQESASPAENYSHRKYFNVALNAGCE